MSHGYTGEFDRHKVPVELVHEREPGERSMLYTMSVCTEDSRPWGGDTPVSRLVPTARNAQGEYML